MVPPLALQDFAKRARVDAVRNGTDRKSVSRRCGGSEEYHTQVRFETGFLSALHSFTFLRLKSRQN